MYWKLCYTTLFQLIYPTRKKVKRRNVYQKVKIRDRLSEKSRVRAGFSGAAIIIIFSFITRGHFSFFVIYGGIASVSYNLPFHPSLFTVGPSLRPPHFSEPVTRVNLQTLKI